jgi:toxin secretion/phage lysis holin
MENKLAAVKLALVGFFSGLGAMLGWKGAMVLVWLAAMLLDYLSGTAAAMKNGEWSSQTARQGLWHKGGMILVVLAALLGDVFFTFFLPRLPLTAAENPGLLLPLVLAWYIVTEVGSAVENAVRLGAPVPRWLRRLLKQGREAVDKAAGEEKSEE